MRPVGSIWVPFNNGQTLVKKPLAATSEPLRSIQPTRKPLKKWPPLLKENGIIEAYMEACRCLLGMDGGHEVRPISPSCFSWPKEKAM